MINQRLKSYFLLMRLHRPIGIYLLLWPTLWALWLAGQGHPDIKNVIIFILGSVIMRSAGCVINDVADRDFDRHVVRTKDRPLTSGKVAVKEALIVFAILGLVALGLVLFLNKFTIVLSIIGLFIAVIYPFTKRFLNAPQLFLGFAFAWGIPMAFTAQTNTLPVLSGWLFLATIFWVIAYDTCYAMVDRGDDLRIGIRSTAILFGNSDVLIIGMLQGLFLLMLFAIGWVYPLNYYFFSALFLAALLVIYQLYLLKDRDPARCFKAFLNNNWIGLIIFIGIVFGI